MPRHSVFDIMGPIMIGPSSSHTAGAVRLGRMVRKIMGAPLTSVHIQLHGSFADTFQGHGTDLAIIAGLLGIQESDPLIAQSQELAAQQGLEITIETVDLGTQMHPNTAKFTCNGPNGRLITIIGHSTGGGSILISRINDYKLALTGELHSIITHHRDEPGVVAAVTKILAQYLVNIASISLSRTGKGEDALMIIEADEPMPSSAGEELRMVKGIHQVTIIPALE